MPVPAACFAGHKCCFVQGRFASCNYHELFSLHRGRRLIIRSAKAAMGLDPQVKDFLDQQNSTPVSYDQLTAEQARKNASGVLK